MPPSSSTFCRTELHRALEEQTFGIAGFHITSASLEQASASVVLLEGPNIIVQLTIQGYSVVSAAPDSQTHETIEELLSSMSPLYTEKRQVALIAALTKLK